MLFVLTNERCIQDGQHPPSEKANAGLLPEAAQLIALANDQEEPLSLRQLCRLLLDLPRKLCELLDVTLKLQHDQLLLALLVLHILRVIRQHLGRIRLSMEPQDKSVAEAGSGLVAGRLALLGLRRVISHIGLLLLHTTALHGANCLGPHLDRWRVAHV